MHTRPPVAVLEEGLERFFARAFGRGALSGRTGAVGHDLRVNDPMVLGRLAAQARGDATGGRGASRAPTTLYPPRWDEEAYQRVVAASLSFAPAGGGGGSRAAGAGGWRPPAAAFKRRGFPEQFLERASEDGLRRDVLLGTSAALPAAPPAAAAGNAACVLRGTTAGGGAGGARAPAVYRTARAAQVPGSVLKK